MQRVAQQDCGVPADDAVDAPADRTTVVRRPDLAWTVPWARRVGFALICYSVTRLLVVGIIVIGSRIAGPPSIWGRFQVFDAGWYLKAAEFGYPHELPTIEGPGSQTTVAFFPVFPMMVRLIVALTPLDYQAAGVALSVVSGLTTTILLWILAERLAGREAADRAVIAFCVFPSTLALLLPFSEGLMLTFSIASLLAVEQRRWVLAGALAAVATATRPTGLAVAVALGWAALVAVLRHREWRAVVAPALAPLGFVGYLAFLWHHTGSPTAWFTAQTLGWGHGQGGVLGVHAYQRMTILFREPLSDMNSLAAGLAVCFAVFGLAVVFWWRPPGHLIAFSLAATWFAMTTGIASRPRYMLAVFPIFLAMGAKITGLRTHSLLVVVLTAIMAPFIIITTATDLAVF